jgi:hypothetical protein
MIDYELGILIAILSYVYTNILTEPDMIFNGLYKKLDAILPRWLFYPLIHCEKCNAGQIALLTYIYIYWPGFYFYPLETIGACALFVGFTIFTVYTIKQLWEKLNR